MMRLALIFTQQTHQTLSIAKNLLLAFFINS